MLLLVGSPATHGSEPSDKVVSASLRTTVTRADRQMGGVNTYSRMGGPGGGAYRESLWIAWIALCGWLFAVVVRSKDDTDIHQA